MAVERRGADEGVRAALEALRVQIDQRVRLEQLRDQLTGLPNEAALLAAVRALLEKKQQFWVAFFEIDRFKWINDSFGYQSADALLRKVAESLEAATQSFAGSVTAFRPHGDEFYLLGEWPEGAGGGAAELGAKLDLARRNVGALRVQTERGVVACTVSVGFVDSESLELHTAARAVVLTQREVFGALERAVGEAKWQKDCVVRFSPELDADETLMLRSDCRDCRCKFQVNLKRSALGSPARWCCPNCGSAQPRPPIPDPSSAPEQV